MATTTLLPAALVANNGVASIANIDEGVGSPDGSTVGMAGTSSYFRVSFPAVAGSLNLGAGLQTFRLRAKRTFSGSPTMVVDVYESGSVVASAILTQNLSSSMTNYSATWNASILSDISGSGVQMHVRKTTSEGVDVDAVDWIADYTPAAGLVLPRARMGTRWMTSKRF